MRRKILFTFILISIFGIKFISAQCTPGAFSNPGIYPDSATNLPHATAGVAYSTVMTAIIPIDTIVPPLIVAIYDVTINSVTGFPANFTYAPNPGTGVFPGGQSSCILIQGSPTVSQIGTYPLNFSLTAHTAAGDLPYSLSYYKIVIDSVGAGISIVKDYRFELLQNTPNPFSNSTNIIFTTPSNQNITFTVMNIVGKVIHTEKIEANIGENKISFNSSELPSGIYVYQINNGKQTITKRMIVNK
jgi:hypothetical protein